jgi:membrane-associated phospholipid phosphatase
VSNPPRAVNATWIAVLLAVLSLLAFIVLAAVVRQVGVPAIDESTSMRLHAFAGPEIDRWMSAVTTFGSSIVLAAVAIVAAVMLESRGHRSLALLMVVATVVTMVLNEVLKLIVTRPRPDLDWAAVQSGYSFPSGHSMNSFVVYVALAFVAGQLWGRRAGILALALAALVVTGVGISRVYLGAHWPTDVVGGFLAAILCLLLVGIAFRVGAWLRSRSATTTPTPAREHAADP